MIDIGLVHQLKADCSSGERSDFVNEAIDQAFRMRNSRRAVEDIERLQKKYDLRVKNGEIVRILREFRYG